MRESDSEMASSASAVVVTEIFQRGRRFIVLQKMQTGGTPVLRGVIEIAPRGEVEQLNFHAVRLPFDFGNAGVIDIEGAHARERQFEQERKAHADNAAVTKHGNGLAGVARENLAEARLHAGAIIRERF